jgi:hypothetical protein
VIGPPYGGFLLGWGREEESGWWGFVSWTDRVFIDGRHTVVVCAGWVAADRLQPEFGVDYAGVRQLRLPADPELWRLIDFRNGQLPAHYYGRTTGEPLPPPCGGTPVGGMPEPPRYAVPPPGRSSAAAPRAPADRPAAERETGDGRGHRW